MATIISTELGRIVSQAIKSRLFGAVRLSCPINQWPHNLHFHADPFWRACSRPAIKWKSMQSPSHWHSSASLALLIVTGTCCMTSERKEPLVETGCVAIQKNQRRRIPSH